MTAPRWDQHDAALPPAQAVVTECLRNLPEAELRGAMAALDTLRTWHAQLEANARLLSDRPASMPRSPRAMALHRIAFANDLTRALQLQIAP